VRIDQVVDLRRLLVDGVDGAIEDLPLPRVMSRLRGDRLLAAMRPL
jgi:hypothetical protein